MTRGALMSVNGDDKELQELTHHLQVGKKILKDGVTGEEHGLHEKNELKVNGMVEEFNVGQGETVKGPVVQPVTKQQTHGEIVCWERFLHLGSLKVLLVENDNSTRHVVTALLRNCCYEVIEAANGLQAWKMLEDLTNHIDLILTEVAMPCFSGIGLLCKIMGHQARKNIPVIMMSSHDSMGLVFKCLSRGAVDFLVKPIRKNELKNLWQHVWRRCHSSSGSGSESGTQTQKSVKSKSLEESSNNADSNNEDNNRSEDINNGNGSDNGSGTQTSWTKQAVEVDSPKQVPQWDQIVDYPLSTCAQFPHSNAQICDEKMVPLATKCCPKHKKQLVKELEVDSSTELDLTVDNGNEFPVKISVEKHGIHLDVGSSKCNGLISRGQLDLNCENPSGMLRPNGPSVSDGITDEEFEAQNRRHGLSDIENKATNDDELPSPEISLKRLRGGGDARTTIQDKQNVARCSAISAFSRYNGSSNTKRSPTECVRTGSNSRDNDSLEVTKKDLSCEIQSHSNGNPSHRSSNGGSNDIDIGSSANNAFTKIEVSSEQAVASTARCLCHVSAVQPISSDLCTLQQVVFHSSKDMTTVTMLTPKGGIHKDYHSEDFHYQFENHDSIADKQYWQLPDHVDSTFKEMAVAAPHYGSSNVVEMLVECNTGDNSVDRRASGSNNGSDRLNGSSTAVADRETNIEGANRSGDASGSKSWSGNKSANRVDQNKTSKREATSSKFGLKRKESCIHKKAQHQSRKKLAEERTHFCGQFVHKSTNENAPEAEDK
ncbi:two-component response regulator-like APRR7 [Neltuma alba]|uniref:two-component response regulator-like APRR7 n=1 Tax=Neltuma alba TaxID=207710 RepID=UPI0010A3BED8|nr:two-component response regulator-like APRR7 [Prosopis alba]XP_028775998.1 two-component response regulator-like APRR7 [Prosopis alba]XP_028775999.1 two-component response regulator-like APRR7 [Prosopis alba]